MNVSAVSSVPIHRPASAQAQRDVRRAAGEFERLMLRSMLSQLEKSMHVGRKKDAHGGSSLYASMIVDALADAVTDAGGIGLADKVAQSMDLGGATR